MNLISQAHNKHCFHIVILSTSSISTNEIEWRISMRNVQWNLTQFSIQLIYLNKKLRKRKKMLWIARVNHRISVQRRMVDCFTWLYFFFNCAEKLICFRDANNEKSAKLSTSLLIWSRRNYFSISFYVIFQLNIEVWKKTPNRCPSGCFVIFNKFVNIPQKWMRTNLFIRWNHFNTWF